MLRRSAALAKLPASTTWANTCMAERRSTRRYYPDSRDNLSQAGVFIPDTAGSTLPTSESRPKGIRDGADSTIWRAGPARRARHDVHRPRRAQVLRLHTARHGAVLPVARPAWSARLLHFRRRADGWRADPRGPLWTLGVGGAGSDPARRDVGARRQRLGVHRAERR